MIESRDFFVQQSGLTGESDSVEKLALSKMSQSNFDSLLEAEALAFMGTNVISGSAKALILAVGDDTMMGEIEQTLNTYDEPTSFERGDEQYLLALNPFDAGHGSHRLSLQWLDGWRLAGSWRICTECWCWFDT